MKGRNPGRHGRSIYMQGPSHRIISPSIKEKSLILSEPDNYIYQSTNLKNSMKVRVYFCKEPDIEIIMKCNKISRQALDTIYDLVWESEFKNILNVGRVWLKFKEEDKPFGISLRDKRTHNKISLGDIIQIDKAYYMVNSVGARKVRLVD
jgi:hypothetical protein